MSITKPVKNQMAFWEKINKINNASGTVEIDIPKSTIHLISMINSIIISFNDISNIPEDSFVSLSLLFIGNGTYTITFPSTCNMTSGSDNNIFIPSNKLGIQLFSIDRGITWKLAPFTLDF